MILGEELARRGYEVGGHPTVRTRDVASLRIVVSDVWIPPLSDTLDTKYMTTAIHESISDRFLVADDTLCIGIGYGGLFGFISVQEPAPITTFAIAGPIVPAGLALVVRGKLLLLSVKELAVLSGETPPRGFVVLADTPRF